jgi:hypothetical protein
VQLKAFLAAIPDADCAGAAAMAITESMKIFLNIIAVLLILIGARPVLAGYWRLARKLDERPNPVGSLWRHRSRCRIGLVVFHNRRKSFPPKS